MVVPSRKLGVSLYNTYRRRLMGKTSKPLKILVGKEIWNWPEIQKLKEQGHDIKLGDLDRFDLVWAANARNMNEQLKKYLPIAMQDARKRRYPSNGKKKPSKSSTKKSSISPKP
jgi:hypothetical protein